MAQITKRKRADDCIEEGLFGEGGLLFGKISTNDGIKAQGEFHYGSLIYGKVFTDEFLAKGEYMNGFLTNGCRLHYAQPVYENGLFDNNHLKKGVRITPSVIFSGNFDDNHELSNGTLIDKTINQGQFIDHNLKEGIKIADDVIYKGTWSLTGAFLNGTKVHADGTVERGKFEDDELIEGLILNKDGTVFKVIDTEGKDEASATFPF